MVDERLSSNANYSTVILSTGRRMVSSVENSLAKTAIAVCFSALNSAEWMYYSPRSPCSAHHGKRWSNWRHRSREVVVCKDFSCPTTHVVAYQSGSFGRFRPGLSAGFQECEPSSNVLTIVVDGHYLGCWRRCNDLTKNNKQAERWKDYQRERLAGPPSPDDCLQYDLVVIGNKAICASNFKCCSCNVFLLKPHENI